MKHKQSVSVRCRSAEQVTTYFRPKSSCGPRSCNRHTCHPWRRTASGLHLNSAETSLAGSHWHSGTIGRRGILGRGRYEVRFCLWLISYQLRVRREEGEED